MNISVASTLPTQLEKRIPDDPTAISSRWAATGSPPMGSATGRCAWRPGSTDSGSAQVTVLPPSWRTGSRRSSCCSPVPSWARSASRSTSTCAASSCATSFRIVIRRW